MPFSCNILSLKINLNDISNNVDAILSTFGLIASLKNIFSSSVISFLLYTSTRAIGFFVFFDTTDSSIFCGKMSATELTDEIHMNCFIETTTALFGGNNVFFKALSIKIPPFKENKVARHPAKAGSSH
jgi:hypothetical protein